MWMKQFEDIMVIPNNCRNQRPSLPQQSVGHTDAAIKEPCKSGI